MYIDKELTRGSTTILVLSLLERKAMYGYEMIKEAEALSEGVFQFREGTLYPVLHSLESSGLIESFWSEGVTARRRKYYRLTSVGVKQLCDKRKEWTTFTKAVNSIIGGVSR